MTVSYVDILSLIGVGGLWAAMFSMNISRHPLLPTYDPRILDRPVLATSNRIAWEVVCDGAGPFA